MKIARTDEVGNVYYGADGFARETDSDFTELFSISGTKLPRSAYQVESGAAPGLGQVSGVARGSDGTLWLCDTENDRIVELDKEGNVVRYFFGVHFETTISSEETEVVSAMYNPNDGSLYLVFNKDIFGTG